MCVAGKLKDHRLKRGGVFVSRERVRSREVEGPPAKAGVFVSREGVCSREVDEPPAKARWCVCE